MKLTTKISLAVLVSAALAASAWFSLGGYDSYVKDQAYLEQISDMVEYEQWHWFYDINLPEKPQREQWDAQYKMPRVMFYGKKDNDPSSKGGLWSMNLDATDLRIMVSEDEVEGISDLQMSRSPNGRYLIFSTRNRMVPGCSLYDLKLHTAKKLGRDSCRRVQWTKDGSKAYMFHGYGPAIYFSDEQKIVLARDIANSYSVQSASGGWLVDNEQHYVRNADREHFKGDGQFVMFDANTFELVEQNDYFPKICDYKIRYSLDGKSFTCSTSAGQVGGSGPLEYKIYNADNTSEVIGYTAMDTVGIIQKGKLYTNYNHSIVRVRQPGEMSPIAAMRMIYKERNFRYGLSHIYFYLSSNLVDDFEQADFLQYLPPLPTEAQLEKVRRQLAEEN